MTSIAPPRSWTSLVPVLVTTLVVLVGILILLAAGATATPQDGNTTVISTETASPQVPFQAFDANPPKLYDVDGNGRQEIIAQNDNQWVYILDHETGGILFEERTWIPSYWNARPLNGPEVAVMTHGGDVHLIVANSAAVVTSFRFDANASTRSNFTFVKEWDRRLDTCRGDPAMDAKPVLADLDQDGRHEILAATEERGLYALHDDGRLFWTRCLGGGNAAPRVADLDQDGAPDVVHVSDSGFVSAIDGRTGSWMWGLGLRDRFNLGTGSIPVAAGIGSLDDQAGPDVVVGARDSHAPGNWSANHALLAAISSRGELLWSFQDPAGNPLTYTRPIVVDADGDGSNEVYWADWNTVGHKPPPPEDPRAWSRTGPANVYRIDGNGSMVWRTQLGTYWSNKDLAVADVTGDGTQEILANGPDQYDGIWYLDARTGTREGFVSTHPWKVSRGPIVGDLRGNGTTQWVVPVEPATPEVSGGAILVHDTGVPYDAAWPHLPDPDAPGPAKRANGTFNATFRIHHPNTWWQELSIDPDPPQTITDASVRVDDGAWLPMSKSDWGPWTSSHHAPEGSRVVFRVTNATGAVSQSLPFTWLDGTLEQPSTQPGGPHPQPFNASFQVPSNVNEWWIETRVSSSRIVAGVQARVEDGPWRDLHRTGWGTWADSFHVQDFSTIRFRATSNGGHTDESQAYRWPSGDPVEDDPGTQPQPPGNLTASFAVPSGVNAWWVETDVDANQPIALVEARVEDGPWRNLSRTDWGTWAASFRVEDGANVTFQATSRSGETNVSTPLRWPSGEPVGRAPGPQQPEPLDAAFGPKAGNAWWVETYAIANSSIVSVEARANGGAWHELTRRDWGTWAASFHAPEGSQVTFRATNATGAMDTGDAFGWPDAVPAANPDGAWPQEGSYVHYEESGGGPTAEYRYEVNSTFIHHDGRWLVRCEGYTQDPGGRDRTFVFVENEPAFAPTNVSIGDRLDAPFGTCHDGRYDVIVDREDTETVHQEGDRITIDTWFADRTADCRCQAWAVEWDDDTGLVTDAWRGGRTGDRDDLQDTDAPIR